MKVAPVVVGLGLALVVASPGSATPADTGTRETYACDGAQAMDALARAVSQYTKSTYSKLPPSPVVMDARGMKRRDTQWYKDESARGVNHAYMAVLQAGAKDSAFAVWKKSTGTKLRMQVCSYEYTGTLSTSTKLTPLRGAGHYTFGASELSGADGHEVTGRSAGGTGSTKGIHLAIVSPESWTTAATYTARWQTY